MGKLTRLTSTELFLYAKKRRENTPNRRTNKNGEVRKQQRGEIILLKREETQSSSSNTPSRLCLEEGGWDGLSSSSISNVSG